MELTKADKKRIEEETDTLIRRITIEASEYARLYEQTYLSVLAQKIEDRRSASEYVAQKVLEITNTKDK